MGKQLWYIPRFSTLEKQSIGETSLYVTKELLKKIESGEHKIDWNKLHSSSEIKYGLNFDCVNTGTVDKYFDTQVYDSKSSKMNSEGSYYPQMSLHAY